MRIQYAQTILMMKFMSCALYAVPRVRVKSEVYFCLDSLMRRSEERSVFRAVSTSPPPPPPPPLAPPKFGIILQQTILGEMSSLYCKLYLYCIYVCIKRKTSPAAQFKSAFAGWHRARDAHIFKALRIITNHIRFC